MVQCRYLLVALSPPVECYLSQRLANNTAWGSLDITFNSEPSSLVLLMAIPSSRGLGHSHESSAIYFFLQHPIFSPLETVLVPLSKHAQNLPVSLTLASTLSPSFGYSSSNSVRPLCFCLPVFLCHSEETTSLETDGHQKRKTLSFGFCFLLADRQGFWHH